MDVEVKRKKFLLIPRDAFECLARRYGSFDEATAAAQEAVAEERVTMHIVELKAIATLESPPVRVRKV